MKALFACVILLSSLPAFAGPRVDVVVGEQAPALERLAAEELVGQLKRVYEAEVKIGTNVPPADSPHVIFVGSPDTNAHMKSFAQAWPSGKKKLTDQGHLLRSVTHNDKPALLIGGGSPVATFWAVAEFGHRLGIRSMLFGDLDPVAPPSFTLQGLDVVFEPSPRHRGWHFENGYFTDSGSWSVDEYRLAFRQLAKLRFNHITIAIQAWQPYTHFEYADLARSTSHVLSKTPIVVSGDTLGRKAFGGAKVFEHPSFVGAETYAKRRAAGEKQLREIMSAARELGLSVTLQIPISEFPAEFAKLWPKMAEKLSPNVSDFWTKLEGLPNDAKLAGLLKASVRSVIETYPMLDGLQIRELQRDDLHAVQQFFSRPDLLTRNDGQEVPVSQLDFADDAHVLISRPVAVTSPSKPVVGFVADLMPLNVLPCYRPASWITQWDAMARLEASGFQVVQSGIGENDLPAYWLSRRSCRLNVSPEQACRDLLTPVCGDEVDHRVWKAVELIQSATQALAKGDVSIGIPRVQTLLEKTDPPPPEWNTARDGFLNAMNEMYRANTRAREGGRAYTLYLARRFEFAFEYMNYAEAVRKSAIAERANDRETQIAEIEKAIESLNGALNAMAAVARSNSDRGLIAVLNEYGYRPLKKKLAEAEEAAK